MVLVEFFDTESVNNLIGVLTLRPEKVYLVGESKKVLTQSEKYNRFLEHRGEKPVFTHVSVNKNNIAMIVDKLSKIIEESGECCFDLMGGDDVALMSVGIVYEKYKNNKNISLYRYNVKNDTVSLVERTTDKTVDYASPRITVAENVAIHGGSVSDVEFETSSSGRWDFASEEFEKEVNDLWKVLCNNPSEWNADFVGALNSWRSINEISDNPLQTSVKLENVTSIAKTSQRTVDIVCKVLFELAKFGLITDFRRTKQEISFVYKNENVKRCLSKAGNVLELKTVFMAMKVKEDGKQFYDDFDIQVDIDWDGKYHGVDDIEQDTTNEIDVALSRGLMTFFISCKNGSVGEDELYKLNTVTNRFGGAYAKKVLVATDIRKSGIALNAFRQRAKDMKIILINNVHKLSDEEFINELKKIPDRDF